MYWHMRVSAFLLHCVYLIVTRCSIFVGIFQKTMFCAYSEIEQLNLLASAARYWFVVNEYIQFYWGGGGNPDSEAKQILLEVGRSTSVTLGCRTSLRPIIAVQVISMI